MRSCGSSVSPSMTSLVRMRRYAWACRAISSSAAPETTPEGATRLGHVLQVGIPRLVLRAEADREEHAGPVQREHTVLHELNAALHPEGGVLSTRERREARARRAFEGFVDRTRRLDPAARERVRAALAAAHRPR